MNDQAGLCACGCAAKGEISQAAPSTAEPLTTAQEIGLGLWPLGLAAGLGLVGWLLQSGRIGGGNSVLRWTGLAVLALAWLLAGGPVLRAAWNNLRHGHVFNEMFLMTIASLGAFAIGAMEEAIGVMVFYRVGEFFQEQAAGRSRHSIQALLSQAVDSAHRLAADGSVSDVPAEQVRPGDLILVKPGERLPVDGIVASGHANLDTSAMTGESIPRPATPGREALAGSIVLDGAIHLTCSKPVAESSAAKILQLVQQASHAKAKTELFIRRFARWYTPAVVLVALAVALLAPLLNLGLGLAPAWSTWLYRALVMLVISCPCALVLSIPLGYFAGLGGAARRGILIKGAHLFDALADASTVVFDKTGTLSDGQFQVVALTPAADSDETKLLSAAVAAGQLSNHPLAQAIRGAWQERHGPLPAAASTGFREIAGLGSSCQANGSAILAGNRRWLDQHGIKLPASQPNLDISLVYVAAGGAYLGNITIGDQPKPDAALAVSQLRQAGITDIALLTGDSQGAADRLASHCDIQEVHAGLLPADKLRHFEAIIARTRSRGRGSVLFVGDGTNDAPVLARADAGLAMGSSATDAALESADVVLTGGQPARVAEAAARAALSAPTSSWYWRSSCCS